jgi:hypothetical protein
MRASGQGCEYAADSSSLQSHPLNAAGDSAALMITTFMCNLTRLGGALELGGGGTAHQVPHPLGALRLFSWHASILISKSLLSALFAQPWKKLTQLKR